LQPGFQLTLPTADTTFNPNQIVSAGSSTVNVTVTGGTTLVSFLDRVGS